MAYSLLLLSCSPGMNVRYEPVKKTELMHWVHAVQIGGHLLCQVCSTRHHHPQERNELESALQRTASGYTLITSVCTTETSHALGCHTQHTLPPRHGLDNSATQCPVPLLVSLWWPHLSKDQALSEPLGLLPRVLQHTWARTASGGRCAAFLGQGA